MILGGILLVLQVTPYFPQNDRLYSDQIGTVEKFTQEVRASVALGERFNWLVADSLDAQPRVLLDPNALRADGTAALVIWRPSEDGKLLAYSVAEAGSDWEQVRIRDVATGKDREDWLRWIKWGAVAWSAEQMARPSSRATCRSIGPGHAEGTWSCGPDGTAPSGLGLRFELLLHALDDHISRTDLEVRVGHYSHVAVEDPTGGRGCVRSHRAGHIPRCARGPQCVRIRHGD